MASGWTNRGKNRILRLGVRNDPALPGGGFAFALYTSANTPSADTNVFSELTQIPVANGYADGGINVDRSDGAGAPIGWDIESEDDSTDRAVCQIEDLVYTASGGTLPSSGGARWGGLTDRNATIALREVFGYFDMGADRSVPNGQSITLQDVELRLTE